MYIPRCIALLSALLTVATAAAQTPVPPVVAAAAQWVDKHPTPERRVGLAEILRVHESRQAGMGALRNIGAGDARTAEMVCWRMLPVAPARRAEFRLELARLKKLDAQSPWVPLCELYLLAGESNRTAFVAAIEMDAAPLPERFPGASAERAHLDLLRELGVPRVQASVEVIAARTYEPLHALRDLDRALTREAEFADGAERSAEAKRIRARRDDYRRAYLKASKHLVEKLFALRLSGATKERDALLARAKALPYLHERQRLASLLLRLDEEQAWQRLVEPLLASELTLIDTPPDLPELSHRAAELHIKAKKKSVQDKVAIYAGDVQFRLAGIRISCKQLTVLQGDEPDAVIISGNDSVQLHGFGTYPRGIQADRFGFHAETGSFTLGGDVRLHGHVKTVKLRACTVTQHGELRDSRSLLDDFREAFTVNAKLELLPKIARVYDDSELPDEVRFLFALNLVRPHLTWHAPYLPPLPDRARKLHDEEAHGREWSSGHPWQTALGGEDWMLDDIPQAAMDGFRASMSAWYTAYSADPRNKETVLPKLPFAGKELYFWRLRDPQHADVARAIRLLQGFEAGELGGKAYRWAHELRRNNTAVTFDIAGAAPVGRSHSLLMDVRNAESVSFTLYRVKDPRELLFATRNIGKDFIYRAHGLDDEHALELLKVRDKAVRKLAALSESKAAGEEAAFKPVWQKAQLVHQWTARVADLRHQPAERERRRSWRHWRDDDWHDEADAWYFDDACSQHQPRLDKTYRPRDAERLSSWQCDRVVQIPEKVLAEAGAYVLVAEANGQTAHVPIVVEPLSLTLRRCRDGVFVLASDADGKKPLAGAKIHAFGQRGEASTDNEGAAFARVLAHGDRAIVVHHQGRYAIGGFGQVFEGIYDHGDDERHPFVFNRMAMERKQADAREASASVYADQHVVVAYTDRPTYRPGQDVHFKLIVRKLTPANAGAVVAASFRGEDFDVKTRMVLPELDHDIAYAVLDPKGHEVGHGTLRLSEFGTAAGAVKLNGESVVGSYTMRVRIAGQPRLVPDVFAVQHYRRSNFEVQATGVPDKLLKPETLTLAITGRYYFGPAVAGGSVDVRVVRKDFGKTVAAERGKLDDKGQARIELALPKSLAAGAYLVISSVTDDSGRTVKTTAPLRIASPDAPKGARLDDLPRFIAAGAELKVATTAKEIKATQDLTDLRFTPKNGIAVLKFAAPGWYRLSAAEDEAMLFVYGGAKHPLHYSEVENDDKRRVTRLHPSAWVNLSDFAWQENGHLARWERPAQHMFALFDRQSLKVGDKLRLLVYVPHKNAKLLLTIEGRTVLDYATIWTKDAGAYQIVELPIKERYFPNVYVQGRILSQDDDRSRHDASKAYQKAHELLDLEDDENADPRWCRIDVARATGAGPAPALNVQIDTDRATYRPGDSVRASVKVTDHLGRPQSAELSFAAIDESVFAFGDDNLDGLPSFFRMPYETRRFQPKVWRSGVGSQWSRAEGGAKLNQLMRDLAKMSEASKAESKSAEKSSDGSLDRLPSFTIAPLPRLGGEMPAGQIPLAHLREHFQETAAWLPQVHTDKTGVAQIAFTLPDSLTRYRLTSLALTKTTEVGVGRTRITAGLPLAVQVFLPRFAVEKDRLLAIALIHNHTGEARDCTYSWEIADATAETPAPAADDWKLVQQAGKFVGTGSVNLPANGSAKVGVWLKADQIGSARVAFRAQAGKETDAEVRTLPVQPLGKPAEVNINEQLAAPQPKPAEKLVAGTFHREGRVQLPAGFMARELYVSLAASDLAQALDGLDYLVDYPHGCIEQTMSRFMPLVMIKHATQASAVTLQPDIAKKLPDILQQGLTRVYGHQHADGSWGWFEKDGRNLPMSVYVVYGLARCQATGTKVDAGVLARGCSYLRDELRTNKHEPELAARAWYAIALAGHADAKELSAWAKQQPDGHYRPVVWCNLALACKAAGLHEQAEQFWKKKDAHWWGHDTETFALVLNTQLAFGAPYRDCKASAANILARRSGTHWAHTRDTAWAIEALANMLGYVPDKAAVRKVEITLAGKTILEIRDPAELKKLAWRVKLNAEQLPAQEALELRLKADSDEPIHVAVRAAGVQRQDEVLASGQRIKLQRFIESLEGQPAPAPLKVGQVVRVRLRLDLHERTDYLLIEEKRPSLCEFADDSLAGASAKSAVQQEFRDDRLCVFFTSLPAGTHEIIYYLRAETPGQCSVLPGSAYPMYADKTRGTTASSKIEVHTP